METEKKIEIEREKSRNGDAKNTRLDKKSRSIRFQFQGLWHQPVPRWEKKFCTSVCSIPWKKLCETEKLKYMYPKIVEWNDSEGEEAFHNAKVRYWEEINHLPCTVPLPDPDMYIDIIDHNAVLNPELVEDLYKQPASSEDDERDKGISWDSFQFTTDTVPVTGWGDEEDQVHTIYATDQSIQIQPTGWGDEDDQVPNVYSNDQSLHIQPTGWGDEGDQVSSIYNNDQSIHIRPTGWGEEQDQVSNIHIMDQSIQIQPSGWGDTENCTNGINHNHIPPWNNFKSKNNCGDYHCGRDYSWQHQARWTDEYNRKEQGVNFCSNNTTERYRGRKKAICAIDQTLCYKSHWVSMRSCDPINYRGSADSHGTWQWQKSVS